MKTEKKSRHLAGISLAIMAAGFLLTIPFQDSLWGRLLQGGFEAGLVGGLADWFAVTALFRHPLGIPIPHTGLLPKNRKKITQSVVRIIETEWLSAESIKEKIKQIELSKRIIQLVQTELKLERTKKIIQAIILEATKKLELEKLTPMLEKEFKKYLLSVDASKLLDSISKEILTRQYDEKALDFILKETGKWAATTEAKQTMGKLGKQLIETTEADGLLKFAIHSFNQLVNEEKIGQMMQTFLMNRVRNLSRKDNRYRKLILEWIRQELVEINRREQLMTEINEWKNHFVEELEIETQVNQVLDEIKTRAVIFIEQDHFVDQYINPVLLNFINKLGKDEEKIEATEKWIHNQIAILVEKHHAKIGVLVKENLDKLDTETLIEMMEVHIGKDIQWIRVNGALCGFIIGVALTIFKMLVY
ncbi:DUF445 domain-containing protein [Bacillus sp. B15-48]|uniref:DUF445 domain-containing protein n=1 Tax=Bacillus sp. B15-48 TaxID=1548601 RepID=UPI00193FE3E0|nr:DUF445 domain-containing protein [Bacillus sp. B15-48]